jgi:hypothetical protein
MAIKFTNNATSTLASSINNSVTSLSVAGGQGGLFPTLSGADIFYATISNAGGSVEIVKVTARSTDTFTVVRGQDSTSALSWNAGDKIELRATAAGLTAMAQTANNLSDLASASTSRTNLGLGTIATQASNAVSITGGSITGITDLAVADGGTGASDAATARTNLGLVAIASSGSASDLSAGTVPTARLGSGTANSTTYLRGDQTWATVSGGVTSASAGNGIAVSASTGAVTFSLAVPSTGSVGSYVSAVSIPASGGGVYNFNMTFGSNYAAGSGGNQIQAGHYYKDTCGGVYSTATNALSGTWKWLGATLNQNQTQSVHAVAIRVA